MDERRILVVGDSLFAETLIQMLSEASRVAVVATASTLADAPPLVRTHCPDVVIVATCVAVPAIDALSQLLIAHPNLPVIRADLTTDNVQIITSRWISARRTDLLDALAGLPRMDE